MAAQSYRGQMRIPPGEPQLHIAILRAAQSGSASYVWQWEGIEGWHVGHVVPRVDAYFRVSCKVVSIRHRGGQEVHFGRVDDGRIIQTGDGAKAHIVGQGK